MPARVDVRAPRSPRPPRRLRRGAIVPGRSRSRPLTLCVGAAREQVAPTHDSCGHLPGSRPPVYHQVCHFTPCTHPT